MPAVALFSTLFLEYSQTFVHEEARRHVRYDVEVFCRKRLNKGAFPFDPVHVGGRAYGWTRVDRGFDRLFESRRYDLVHAHFGTGAVYALRYAERFRLPLVVTFHGYDVPLLGSADRFKPTNLRYALLGPRVLQRMTVGLCASRELLEMVHDLGAPRERLRLHHIGVDVDAFGRGKRDPATPRVIMIGRFVEKKGFEYGLRAFARGAAGTRATLTVIGGGEREGALRRLALDLGIGERTRFAGVLTSAEVAEQLRRSDVLLAPSVVGANGNRESGLVVVKEASASQVVPVGTRHGGIPEIIDDTVTGFLVPERSVDAPAERLKLLLSDAPLRSRMGAAARRKMELEYDNRVRVAVLEDRYDEAREAFARGAV